MSNTLAFPTEASLTSAIQAMIEDTGAELTASMPIIIRLGESRLVTDLNPELFDRIATGTFTAGLPEQTVKTANNQGTRSIWIEIPDPLATDEGDIMDFKLQRRSLEFCKEMTPNSVGSSYSTGQPLYYADLSETQIYVAPTPASAFPFKIREIRNPNSIVDVEPTWLATNCGDLLLLACLISTEAYLKADDSFFLRWKAEYAEVMGMRRLELREFIRSDYTPIKNAARTVEDKP